MNKQKMLIMEEIGRTKWLLVFVLIGILAFWDMVYMSCHMGGFGQYMVESQETIFHTICASLGWVCTVMSVLLPVFVAIQYFSVKKRGYREFTGSLPVKAKDFLFARYIVTVSYILIAGVVAAGGCILIRGTLIDSALKRYAFSEAYELYAGNDSIGGIISAFGLFVLIMIAMYSILVLIQTVVNNAVLASVAGAFAILSTSVVPGTFADFIDFRLPVVFGAFRGAFFDIYDFYGVGTDLYSSGLGIIYKPLIAILAMVIVIAIAVFLTIMVVEKRDLSKENTIVNGKIARIIIAVDVAMVVGVFVTGVDAFLQGDYSKGTAIAAFSITSVIVAVVLMMFFSKKNKKIK